MQLNPDVVTVHTWRVPPAKVAAALTRMARDRAAVRRLAFAKLLGTGSGTTFAARDVVATRYALVACWPEASAADAFEQSAAVRGWDRIASERCRVRLRPLSSRGHWSRHEPFGSPRASAPSGPVAAITRARLSLRAARRFWRAVPPVAHDLHAQPGLLLAFGIGEAPVGVQGTFSVWRSAADLQDFAYGSVAHRDVIRRTPSEQWYAEELFARFAILGADGTIDGRNPLDAPPRRGPSVVR